MLHAHLDQFHDHRFMSRTFIYRQQQEERDPDDGERREALELGDELLDSAPNDLDKDGQANNQHIIAHYITVALYQTRDIHAIACLPFSAAKT